MPILVTLNCLVSLYYIVCAHICVCVYLCACVYAQSMWAHVCIHVRRQKLVLGVPLRVTVLRQGLSQNLELTNLAKLPG